MASKNLEIGKQSLQYNVDSYNFLGWKDLERKLRSAETDKWSVNPSSRLCWGWTRGASYYLSTGITDVYKYYCKKKTGIYIIILSSLFTFIDDPHILVLLMKPGAFLLILFLNPNRYVVPWKCKVAWDHKSIFVWIWRVMRDW